MEIGNIKFKAKRLDNGEWCEGDISRFEGTIWIVSIEDSTECGEVDPSTVCQFTGLKDSEGNEV